LYYYLHKFSHILNLQIIEELEQIYKVNNINLQLMFNIFHNFVLINFNRSIVSCTAIKTVIEQDVEYGKKENHEKHFMLHVEVDDESEITNLRLNLLKKVSSNLLKCKSCDNKNYYNNYVFTIKSEGNVYKDYNRYLCGVVLNTNKKKECIWSEEMYLQRKIEKIKKLSSQKCSSTYFDTNTIEDVKKIANAAVAYELLSVKHSSPVIVEKSNDTETCIKGIQVFTTYLNLITNHNNNITTIINFCTEAAFILYNNVRITAVLDKYKKLVLQEEFPEIIPIEKIESFYKITDEVSFKFFNSTFKI
jgi:hypothetical protein